MVDGLAAVGWDGDVAAAFERFSAAEGMAGRVIRVDRGESSVWAESGVLRALSDSQRAQGRVAPATGDWVWLTEDAGLGEWVVDSVLPRHSAMVRRDPAEHAIEQVLVANVDVVGVVHACDRPFNESRIERLLVLAWDSGAEPAAIITKADVGSDVAGRRAQMEAVAPNVPVLVTSAKSGLGIAELRALTQPNRTLVFIGESGAGKSSLVNVLVGEERQATAAVRDRDGAGRHTTTTRDLVPLPTGGVLIDTPGLRAVGVWDADEAVARVYVDIEVLADDCRFRNCGHTVEPGCAVRAAVEAGELDTGRLQRYQRLKAELLEQADERAERARRGQRRPRRDR